MTSLFSRLQKLNKEATPAPWEASRGSSFNQAELRAPDPWNGLMLIRRAVKEDDIDLIVECRNSLPAVLNLIEATQEYEDCADWYRRCLEDGAGRNSLGAAKAGYDVAKDKLDEAVAVFVSGQEEQP